MLTHLSLFTGIGGLDLAAEWAGFETVGQCEWADYPTKVLEKHWPYVPRWRDIRDVTADDFIRRTRLSSPTVISGGFPCQPHSYAGERRASDDERDLWDEFARVIREINPRWVVGENVLGLLTSEHGRFFGGILRDLAKMGYDAGWCVYPAAWVGAVHRRERIFIIAHAKQSGQQELHAIDGCIEAVYQGRPPKETGFDPAIERVYGLDDSECIRAGDGVPYKLDRVAGLGNAVVPQQAYPIFAAIAEAERMRDE